MEKISVICPCCESHITVDGSTGAVLAFDEKKKVVGSFEDLRGELDKKKELRDQLFSQEMSSQKDRERLLEEKFQEARKRAGDDIEFALAGHVIVGFRFHLSGANLQFDRCSIQTWIAEKPMHR